MPIVVRAKNFVEEVLEAQEPVLVDFYGDRCVPCQLLSPILLELSNEFKGLKFCMFNTDRDTFETDSEYEDKFNILAAYQIMSLPTLLLFVDGELRASMIGLHTRDELLKFFHDHNVFLTPRIVPIDSI